MIMLKKTDVKLDYIPTKWQTVIAEFEDSGEEIMEIVVPGRKTDSICAACNQYIKRSRISNVKAVQYHGKAYMVRLDSLGKEK